MSLHARATLVRGNFGNFYKLVSIVLMTETFLMRKAVFPLKNNFEFEKDTTFSHASYKYPIFVNSSFSFVRQSAKSYWYRQSIKIAIFEFGNSKDRINRFIRCVKWMFQHFKTSRVEISHEDTNINFFSFQAVVEEFLYFQLTYLPSDNFEAYLISKNIYIKYFFIR